MDEATVGLATSFISSVGFPIFVAVWMLFKSSKDSAEMKAAINELRLTLSQLRKDDVA
jgi:hypothetical protein